MPLIERFEEIIGWQEARKLVKEIYKITFDAEYQHTEKTKAIIGGLKTSLKKRSA